MNVKDKKVKKKDRLGNGKKIPVRDKKILEIRKKLLIQREALLSEAGLAITALPDENLFPELGDQASAEIDRNFMLRLKGRERKLLNKIDEAVEKIDSHVYGICEVCGEEINVKRLEARPVTTMCIECKIEQEEEEKLRER
jgi:DnaK suppressor protein